MTSPDSPLDSLLLAGLTVQAAPPREPLSWAGMLALLPDSDRPVVAQMKVGGLVSYHLRASAKPAPRPWTPLGDLCGIPIAIDPDMPIGAWRIIDTDGNVMSEGNLFSSGRKADET